MKSPKNNRNVAISFACYPLSMTSPLPATMLDDFTATYDLYQEAIFRYCMHKCGDRDTGKDLTQETFMRYWLCLQRNEPIEHPRAFLYRIAHNLFIDHVRRKKEASLDQLLEVGFEPSIDTWHETIGHLDAERPLAKMKKMAKVYRQVLQKRFMQGLTPANIAKLTGETTNVVSVRIFRGLKQLRILLKKPAIVL